MEKKLKPNAKSTLFEFACSLNSQLGLTSEQCDINQVRLCKEHIDLGDENRCSQVNYQMGEAAKTAPLHLRSSIPCTSLSPWQYISRKRGGAAFMKRLARQLCESKCLFKSFSRRAELVRWYCFFRVAQTLNWMESDGNVFFDAHPPIPRRQLRWLRSRTALKSW